MARKTTNARPTEPPFRSNWIAICALAISVLSLGVAIFTTYQSQRAYVFAKAANAFNVQPGSPPQVYVLIDNGGKTLAHIKSQRVGVTVAEKLPERLEELGEMQPEPGKFVAWPNQPSYIIRSPIPNVILTDGDIRKLDSSESRIYVFGKIEYQDIFHLRHTTTFCHMYSGGETTYLPPNNHRGYHATQAKHCDKFNNAE